MTAKVDWIDKVAPTAELKYEKQDDKVIVTVVNPSKEITFKEGNGIYEYTKNGNYEIVFYDSLGNVGKLIAKIDSFKEEIKDDENKPDNPDKPSNPDGPNDNVNSGNTINSNYDSGYTNNNNDNNNNKDDNITTEKPDNNEIDNEEQNPNLDNTNKEDNKNNNSTEKVGTDTQKKATLVIVAITLTLLTSLSIFLIKKLIKLLN